MHSFDVIDHGVAKPSNASMRSRMKRVVFLLLAAAICLGIYAPAVFASDNVTVIEVQQTQASLAETYAKDKKMGLPRMVLLNADGQVVYGALGLRSDLSQVLRKALVKNQPMNTPITLDAILAEVQKIDGSSLRASDLPKADAYVVDYWASWCSPCRMMSRDLKTFMSIWRDKSFVWIKVESDPDKIQDKHQKS